MYSNLLKRSYTQNKEEKRVIQGDDLSRRRIEELARMAKEAEHDGFSEGLFAAAVEMPNQGAEEESGESQSNVIKANPGEDVAALIDTAREEADRLLKQAKEEAETLKSTVLNQAQKEKKLVLEQAREQGREEGLAQVRAQNSRLEAEWQEKSRLLEEEYRQKFDELEPLFVDTIAGIYEHIFHVDLGKYKEILIWLISSTMRNIEGSRRFFIHVSKEDYETVSAGKSQIVSDASAGNISVEVIEDMTLAENECLIETECGIFDCGLGTQLSELRQKLKLLSYEKQS